MLKISQPQDASKLMSSVLPEDLVFYRIPIPNQEREMSDGESQPPQSREHSSDTGLTPDLVNKRQAHPVPIYGSVSTTDIAEQVKSILCETEEGARLVLGAEDIIILNDGGGEVNEEAGRLKGLGDFPIEIRVKNGDAVRKTVRVIARDST